MYQLHSENKPAKPNLLQVAKITNLQFQRFPANAFDENGDKV